MILSKTILERILVKNHISMLQSKNQTYSLNILTFCLFLYVCVILLVFKIEGNIPEKKDWLNKYAN